MTCDVKALRAVVTGYGVHAAVDRIEEAFELFERGETRLTEQELSREAGGVGCLGAGCSSAPPLAYLPQRKWIKYMGPQTQYAVWAAGKALEHAGLWSARATTEAVAERAALGLFLASGPIAFELSDVVPGINASLDAAGELDFGLMGTAGLRSTSPMMPFHTLLNMPIGLTSMVFGIQGANAIYYPDCEQALFALSAATRSIEHGRSLGALVGGTAHLRSLMPLVSYRRRGWLADTQRSAQPFSVGHRGWGIADGAGMLVLESEARALGRGAKIHARLEVDAMPSDSETLGARYLAGARRPDLFVVTGTLDEAQEAEALTLADAKPCLSLDGAIGYSGSASLAQSLAAACCLLTSASLFRGGTWLQHGTIEVLFASPGPRSRRSGRWGRVRLEKAS